MTTKKQRMTEAQFIAKFKKMGMNLYNDKEIAERIEEIDKDILDFKSKRVLEKITNYTKQQFTAKMFKEIKEIAAAGFHYQAFVLLGVFIKHLKNSYCDGHVIEPEIASGIAIASEEYKPGSMVRFSSTDHMQKHKSGARILSIHETLKEIEQEIERKGILKDDFLSLD